VYTHALTRVLDERLIIVYYVIKATRHTPVWELAIHVRNSSRAYPAREAASEGECLKMEQLPEIKYNQECRIKRKRTLCIVPYQTHGGCWMIMLCNYITRDNDGAHEQDHYSAAASQLTHSHTCLYSTHIVLLSMHVCFGMNANSLRMWKIKHFFSCGIVKYIFVCTSAGRTALLLAVLKNSCQ